MRDQLQLEFRRLAQSALGRLEEVAESGSYTRIFSYWKLPSFDDQACYSLYAPQRSDADDRPILNVTVWRRGVDVGKFRDPVERLRHPSHLDPTIEAFSYSPSPETIAEVIELLEMTSLPSLRPAERMIELDGAEFRLSIRHGFALDVIWWSAGPSPWQEATARIEEMISKLITTSAIQPVSD